ncbi:hypothetical protein RRG40_02510 [Mycoplasmopsis felis]|uniref:Mbov_0398 family ICE element protein n=1 Tax=Mycoplasmopsis felis TaxID=33923 RepID=UPI002B00350C|nr:hypothetical protein [Mycoplasmopsis felis]WQQ05496.1 hypothetical protein RRG59_04075 [Mycoplasmopsis felis]
MRRKTKVIDKSVLISFRINGDEDIAKYLIWKQEIEKNGSSVYSSVRNILMEKIEDTDTKVSMRKSKDNIFYSLRKAMFASMSPFKHSLEERINENQNQLVIMNKKLDLIINLLANEFKQKSQIENIPGELLKEASYFEEMKKISSSELKAIKEKNEKLDKERSNTFNKYLDGEFENEEFIEEFDEE